MFCPQSASFFRQTHGISYDKNGVNIKKTSRFNFKSFPRNIQRFIDQPGMSLLHMSTSGACILLQLVSPTFYYLLSKVTFTKILKKIISIQSFYTRWMQPRDRFLWDPNVEGLWTGVLLSDSVIHKVERFASFT